MSLEPTQRLPRGFHWLNATQFFGALNDNVFKLFIIFSLIRLQGQDAASGVTALAGAVFVLPFLLFAAVAGVLADRVSKRRIVVAVKAAEIVIMVLGTLALAAPAPHFLYSVLFLMAAQSAFFGPAKYGIVPELVGRERLSRANSYLQAFTYLAIILGTGLAPFLSSVTNGRLSYASVYCVVFAGVGLAAALGVPPTPAAGAQSVASLFFVRDIWRTLRGVAKDGYLMLAVLASAYFLLIGAFVQMNIIPYGIQVLGYTQEASAYLFLFAAFGIGAGSLLAGRMSGRNIEFGLVPLGSVLLTACLIVLAAVPPRVTGIAALILLAGVGAGLFIVPLQAFIQFRSPRERLGEVLAASSFLSWVGVLLAAGLLFALSEGLALSACQGFLIIGLLTLVLTGLTLWILPDFALRFIVVLITRTVYRLRVVGAEHLPVEGPALIVANHVSWADAVLVLATSQRRIRFVMAREVYQRMRWLRPVLRLAGVIPISAADGREAILESLQKAREQLDDGYIVCIFAEGAVTRSGMMREFKSGFQRILRGSDHPIVPAYIGGAWGSIFSYYHGRLFSRMPTRIPYPVTLLYGEPLPADSSVARVRGAVQELSCRYFGEAKPYRRPLPVLFAETARRRWGQELISDTLGLSLKAGETLVAALALARGLRRALAEGESCVGILMPASGGGALANLAVAFTGRAAVNLNFTASREALASAVEQCGIRHVLTSKAFLEKLGDIDVPGERICIEDLRGRITRRDKVVAWLLARGAPLAWLGPFRRFDGDQLATVMFSSGSTGTPKGVMLSHHNIISNIEGADLIYRLRPDDVVCGSLPLFHSFGFTCTLWLPLLTGIAVCYHPNPLDAGRIVRLVREKKCTFLVATPTFLSTYLRKATAEDFRTLRFCIVGAEKLKDALADAFEQTFGLRPLEGYGATELSPLVSCNVPDVKIDGVQQVGTRPGSVGHPLPGIAARVVDLETGAVLEGEEAGLLQIKGPNVMLGYLGQPEATRDVVQDGWYRTGDVARLDAHGFITITDRLSRFSKIGGEMVPHMAVEDALLRGLGSSEPVVAVTSLPHEKKGERLVVLHAPAAGDPVRLQQILRESDLPNLWKPAPADYVAVEQIPLLGSGKLDLQACRRLAAEKTGASAAGP